MTTLIAPCGLDCAQCEAYLVTQADDLAGKEALAAKWSVDFNVSNMTVQDVTCDGCLATTGRHGSHCGECEIRACAIEHSLATCAQCSDYACNRLQGFFQIAPVAQVNLDALR
jgi:hypothetical protein